MKHPERVEDYLEHIADAVERAISYLDQTPDLPAFAASRRDQDAVVRNIEIIGEAANKIHRVDPTYQAQHPGIPWGQMRALRNLVIHEYFFVDLEIIWKTVKADLPMLREQVQALLG